MQKDVTFDSKGLTCRGWLYTPDYIDTNQKVPTIIMAHGFSAVKEQALPGFAERFAEAGLRTLPCCLCKIGVNRIRTNLIVCRLW